MEELRLRSPGVPLANHDASSVMKHYAAFMRSGSESPG
jgi:hypothetical protein